MSAVEGAQDVMAPKKLILNPPKNPTQNPTTRIKFTNINKPATGNKAIMQPGIAIDEDARRRQDEHVRAASGGQAFTSTETPFRMPSRNNASRQSASAGTTPVGTVEASRKRSASVASLSGIDDSSGLPGDLGLIDPALTGDAPPSTSENLQPVQHAVPATSMQPPAIIPQQSHSAQIATTPAVFPQQSHSAQVTAIPAIQVNYPIDTAFDRVMRDPGKGALPLIFTPCSDVNHSLGIEDALYRRIQAETHPDIQHPRSWLMHYWPSETQTQHGMVVHLPPSHSWLRITTFLSQECLLRSASRVVVSRDLEQLRTEELGSPGVVVCDVKLNTGNNVICVDVLANINKHGEPAPEWPRDRHDFERFTLTVHSFLME